MAMAAAEILYSEGRGRGRGKEKREGKEEGCERDSGRKQREESE